VSVLGNKISDLYKVVLKASRSSFKNLDLQIDSATMATQPHIYINDGTVVGWPPHRDSLVEQPAGGGASTKLVPYSNRMWLPSLPGFADELEAVSDPIMDDLSTTSRASQVLEALVTPHQQVTTKRVRLTIPVDQSMMKEVYMSTHFLKRRSAVTGLSPNSSLSIGAVM
jgi:hypothetical protein